MPERVRQLLDFSLLILGFLRVVCAIVHFCKTARDISASSSAYLRMSRFLALKDPADALLLHASKIERLLLLGFCLSGCSA